jgi:hypothetical protein
MQVLVPTVGNREALKLRKYKPPVSTDTQALFEDAEAQMVSTPTEGNIDEYLEMVIQFG